MVAALERQVANLDAGFGSDSGVGGVRNQPTKGYRCKEVVKIGGLGQSSVLSSPRVEDTSETLCRSKRAPYQPIKVKSTGNNRNSIPTIYIDWGWGASPQNRTLTPN